MGQVTLRGKLMELKASEGGDGRRGVQRLEALWGGGCR